MGDKEEKKISFSISSKPHPPKPLPHSFSSATVTATETQFLTAFDPSDRQPDPTLARLIIPPIPNTDLHRGGAGPIKDPEEELRRFREELHKLPECRGLDEFATVPVDRFAAAVLAGYGWTEGRGIGRNTKGDVKVVQYDRRAGTQGLGYVPASGNGREGGAEARGPVAMHMG